MPKQFEIRCEIVTRNDENRWSKPGPAHYFIDGLEVTVNLYHHERMMEQLQDVNKQLETIRAQVLKITDIYEAAYQQMHGDPERV